MTQPSYSLDMFDPAYARDPYPMLDRMREEAPIQFDPRLHGWLIGRHNDVMVLQRDPRLSSKRYGYMSAALPPDLKERIKPLIDFAATWITMLDGPEHKRVRKLGLRAFQPSFLSGMAGRIRELCDGYIERGRAAGGIELMSEFAYPLAQTIIGEMVGIPQGDRPLMLKWVADLNGLLAANLTTAARIDHAQESFRELRAYFTGLVEERRARPVADELLSNLVAATDEGEHISTEEIVALVAVLISGAYDTTSHLIGNLMALLLTNPTEWAALREDPDLAAPAVEEALRFEPSILLNTRLITEPIDYEGVRFEAGQSLYFLSGAANRDPSVFADPGRFIIRRAENRHISFGFGPHFCIGAALARQEAQIAVRRFAELAPDVKLAEQTLERAPGFITRPLVRLALELR